jgi:hypothetical protein
MTRKILVALFALAFGFAVPATMAQPSCCSAGAACCGSGCCK